MKILITTDCYAPTVNGVVTSVLNLQHELLRMGHKVQVLTLSPSTHSYFENFVTYIGSVTAEKIYPGVRVRSAPASKLIQDIIDWSPDIIHTQSEFSTFVMAQRIASACNIPIVHTYHTVYEDYTHYFFPSQKFGRRVVSGLSRWIIEKTACVIAPTEKVRLLLESYGIDRRTYVIPTGIDLEKFAALGNPQALGKLREKLNIPKSNKILIYVGRLAKEKNIDELIDFKNALQRDDVTLLLVGDGPYRKILEEKSQSLGIGDSVIFAGMISPEHVADYYHLADIFVSASSSETQGLTYIEALAAGLPILCRKDACLDGILTEEKNGWQYESEKEFSEKLLTFIGSEALQRYMSSSAIESAAPYSIRNFAKSVERVYKDQTEMESKQHKRWRAAS